MHSHLVAVKIRIEGSADQWMNLDSFTFDQHRLERLDAESMQRRRAIQQHGMFANNLFKNVPNDRLLALNHFPCLLDRGRVLLLFELVVYERLEQLEGHLLRQAALMQLEFRTDYDY